MKRINWLTLTVAAAVIANAQSAAGQPAIPLTTLPSTVPVDVSQAIKRLYSPLPGQRIAAIIQLGGLGEKAAPAVPFLLALWDDAEPATMKTTMPGGVTLESTEYPRWQAVKAFGRIGKPAVAPLVAALVNENEMIRRIAAQGLGAIKDPRAIEPLIAAAQSTGNDGGDARESLHRITGQDLATAAEWTKWWDENKAKYKKIG